MGLTQNDLMQIRSIVQEVVRPLQGEIEALRNDVKEIYQILSQHETRLQRVEESINIIAAHQGISLLR